MRMMTWWLIAFMMLSLAVNANKEADLRKKADLRSYFIDDLSNLRKPIEHLDATSSLRHPTDPCRFKHCYVGQQCVVDGVSGKGTCVCKRHCRKVDKPICGSDGNFYMNRCEMHRAACITGSDVTDARHKDCFHKKSICNESEATVFRQHLLEYYHSITSLLGHNINTSVISSEMSTNEVTTNISNKAEKMFPKTLDNDGYQTPNDDVITNDVRGDDVKLLFRYLDMDGDGLVGSEEAYELTLIEGLDSIFPPPCTIFHLLRTADANQDNRMDIREMLRVYNVNILYLPNEDKFVRMTVTSGLPTTIRCAIRGEEEPVWKRRGADLSVYGAKLEGATVKISSIHPGMAGNLTCHARTHPEVEQVIELSIISKPHVQVYPAAQHVSPGSSVTLQCHASGVPPPQVTWVAFDKPLDNDRFIELDTNRELHINNATPADSAAYSCVATNAAGRSYDIAAVIVDNVMGAQQKTLGLGLFFIFHKSGVTLVSPSTCQILRVISAAETVPGLLRQNKVCRTLPGVDERECAWSEAVAVGSRFVYAAQPEENRVLVLDAELQRVVEVLATDALPSSLQYAALTDELFILCWLNWSRDRSSLLLVTSASVQGTHEASQIQPLDGENRVDYGIVSLLIPRKGEDFTHGFVARRNQQAVQKLHLGSLLYDDNIIDLSSIHCVPKEFEYQPIGGVLRVTCQDGRRVHTDARSGKIIPEEFDHFREYVSKDSRYMIGQSNDSNITFYRISNSGVYEDIMKFEANLTIDDIVFVEKVLNNEIMAFLSSQQQDYLLQVDTTDKSVKIIEGISFLSIEAASPWNTFGRPLVQSAWYDRHLATPSDNHVHFIDLNDSEVTC